MQVRIFNTVDGAPLPGSNVVPVSDVSWSKDYNEPGSLSFNLPPSLKLARWGARRKLRPWKHCAALIDGDRVVAAGPITRRKWALPGKLDVTCGGGWSILDKRLVLNHALESAWHDGEILLDEDNPQPEWILEFAGLSYGGIGAGLIRETLRWGALLIDEPALESGTREKRYQGWDFATVADRLDDLANLLNGPMIRFVPYLREDGHLRFRYESGAVGKYHRLAETMPGHGVVVEDVDEDGGSMATQAFALGGRDDDIVLAARSVSTKLTAAGWPVMQVADKSHTSVSRLPTLKGYTDRLVEDGATVPESTKLRVRASAGVEPGDVIDLTTANSFHGKREVLLHVASVSGDFSEWCDVSGFPEEVPDVEANE